MSQPVSHEQGIRDRPFTKRMFAPGGNSSISLGFATEETVKKDKEKSVSKSESSNSMSSSDGGSESKGKSESKTETKIDTGSKISGSGSQTKKDDKGNNKASATKTPDADSGLTLVERVRAACLSRGASGIKGISIQFRIMDDNGNKMLDFDEFSKGLHDFGIKLTASETKELFKDFDANGDGNLSFDEFLLKLRPPLSESRLKVIADAFNKVDLDGDGIITVKDLARKYDPTKHPKYQSGEWEKDQVFAEFLKTFDSPNEPNGEVTLEEWTNYYAGVSASIDEDNYFVTMMRQNWKI